jgi:aminopeptidase
MDMWDKLAELLVRYSAVVRPGEVISLLGPPAAEDLLTHLYWEVLKEGGHPILLMQPIGLDLLRSGYASPQQLAFVDPLLAREVEVADVAIHVLPAPAPEKLPQHHALLERSRRPLLDRFLQRVAERTLRWTATVFPWERGIWDKRIPVEDYHQALVRAMRLDRPDPLPAWRELKQRQARLIDSLQQVRELHFVTAEGTDLHVGVAGRRWTNGAGRENMPDGEVYTTPILDAVDGTVCFDFPNLLTGQRVTDLRLTIRAGRIVDATPALPGLDAKDQQIGEVALGCNYAIDRPMFHPLIDEKIGGTFHLALGMPLLAACSDGSALHCDLIADLRPGGRIEADGKVISVDGRFVDPAWPQPQKPSGEPAA